jgi:hypothetical protein
VRKTARKGQNLQTETTTATAPVSDTTVEEKINQMRELFADAPKVGRTALEKMAG